MPGSLPEPTRDLTLAKRHMDEFGYCLLEGALAPAEVDALRERLFEQREAEAERNIGRMLPDRKQLVVFLLNKGKVFRDMILHQGLHAIVRHVLGEQYLLSSYHAHFAHPGSKTAFHTDQFWMPPPTNAGKQTLVKPGSVTRSGNRGHHVGGDDLIEPTTISPAVVCNAMWMLDDFTEENGATLVVPGSHLSGRQPDHDLDAQANWTPALGSAARQSSSKAAPGTRPARTAPTTPALASPPTSARPSFASRRTSSWARARKCSKRHRRSCSN